MVRVLKDTLFVDGKHYIHAAGLSTDQKPTSGIVSGSYFVEVDTGKEYLFDETGETWYEKPVRPILPE
jgi:hypothetical protein